MIRSRRKNHESSKRSIHPIQTKKNDVSKSLTINLGKSSILKQTYSHSPSFWIWTRKMFFLPLSNWAYMMRILCSPGHWKRSKENSFFLQKQFFLNASNLNSGLFSREKGLIFFRSFILFFLQIKYKMELGFYDSRELKFKSFIERSIPVRGMKE